MPTPTISFQLLNTASVVQAQSWVIPVVQPKEAPKDDKKEDTASAQPLVLEGGSTAALAALGLDANQLQAQWLQDGFKAANSSVWVWRNPTAEASPQRVLFLGLGTDAKRTPALVSKAYTAAVSTVRKFKEDLHAMALVLPAAYSHAAGSFANETATSVTVSEEDALLAVVDGVYEATYQTLEAKKAAKPLPTVSLLTSAAAESLQHTLSKALAFSEGRVLTKDLVNMPANLKTTQTMVDAAKTLASQYAGVSVTVQDDPAWIAKEMPCFYSVARGSLASDPPKFIRLHYKGTNAIHKVALVGKSVIFDTGGYQVKPGNSMVTMKGDMAGGASVLGAFKALLALKPEHLEINVYLAATPNKIDSDSFIPDSILETTCGKKVEMRHTDAEGRLTLIDAVTKAELENPDVIITVATLTGAAMRAVGRCIALMGNNTAWRSKLEVAARTIDEPLQVLDLLPEDFENISSKLDGADIRNTSKSDNRGAQSAAAFILAGVKEQQPLLHLDIAGADMWQNETASALSVRTLATFLLQL